MVLKKTEYSDNFEKDFEVNTKYVKRRRQGVRLYSRI